MLPSARPRTAPAAIAFLAGSSRCRRSSCSLPEISRPNRSRRARAARIAGLLVGFGIGRGNGCTYGHGVCGISRLSVRSIVATLVFMATANSRRPSSSASAVRPAMSIIIQFAVGLTFGLALRFRHVRSSQGAELSGVAAIRTGNWDPSLAFVMMGAVVTAFIGFRLVLKRPRSVLPRHSICRREATSIRASSLGRRSSASDGVLPVSARAPPSWRSATVPPDRSCP